MPFYWFNIYYASNPACENTTKRMTNILGSSLYLDICKRFTGRGSNSPLTFYIYCYRISVSVTCKLYTR